MKEIILPVHPFSRQILLHEHGTIEPLIIRQHDVLFGLLSLRRVKPRTSMLKVSQTLTATVSLALDDDLAATVIPNAYHIGWYLFRLHRDTMCRYVQAAAVNGTPAMHALRQFYTLHQITEDDYQQDSAWKAWQRWSDSREKKPVFSTQKKGNPAAFLCEKKRARAKRIAPLRPMTLTLHEVNVELAIARFLASYANLFRRTPKRLEQHVRIYMYMVCEHLSGRQVAVRLGVKPWAACYAKRIIEQRARRSAALRRLLQEHIALPQPA